MNRKIDKKRTACAAVLFFCLFLGQASAEGNPFTDLLEGTVVCFPHIAVGGGWDTEVALINPTQEAVNGALISYDDQGGRVSQSKTIQLNPNARIQFTVSKDFSDADKIAYMIFESDVFGVKGYTKFYRNGNRVSIIASGARMSGVFSKIEKDGGTGIAFVNMENSDASVVLTAYHDEGDVAAQNNLTVKGGCKVVKVVEELFPGKDISQATYLTFISNKGLVGFFLNQSADETMLDGSQAL